MFPEMLDVCEDPSMTCLMDKALGADYVEKYLPAQDPLAGGAKVGDVVAYLEGDQKNVVDVNAYHVIGSIERKD